jgi:hypothetical protein
MPERKDVLGRALPNPEYSHEGCFVALPPHSELVFRVTLE